MVHYRYCLESLSAAGSLKNEGGCFNVGSGLSPGVFTPFPAVEPDKMTSGKADKTDTDQGRSIEPGTPSSPRSSIRIPECKKGEALREGMCVRLETESSPK